jgi:RES domain
MRPAPPPGNLAQQSLPLQLFAAPVFRLWQNHHPSAFFWSKKGIYRFDSKSARYGVLYTGGTLEGAALEVFGDQWVKRRVLSRVLLKKYRVSVMLPTRRLSLVDTTGSNLNKLSVDSSLFASINYRLRTRKPTRFSRGMNRTFLTGFLFGYVFLDGSRGNISCGRYKKRPSPH